MKIIPIAKAQTKGSSIGLALPPPLSLYVHFPWCVKKCPYCDFNSHEARRGIPEEDYLAALIDDLERALPQIWGRRVVSIFIGGGTPSLLSAKGLNTLLQALRQRLTLLADAEITLEANPGTVEAGKFAAFRDAGVNRLSLGIQSFDDPSLVALGRIHDGREARVAVDLALRHFDRVNLDLMYGLPQQTLAMAQRDFSTAVGLGASHLSAYQLTLEPNTAFHQTPPALPAEDVAAAIEAQVSALLAGAGYQHYETSTYAQPGARCQHNLNYWRFGDYLGLGAGAHGKLSSHLGIIRESRRRDPAAYLSGNYLQERQNIAAADLGLEFMMNALRLIEGFPASLFEERTGLPLASLQAPLLEAQRRGLLAFDAEHIAPTPLGQRYLNDLLQIF